MIGVVYDIGVYKGKFLKGLKKVLFDVEFVFFEVNNVYRDELKKFGFNFYIVVFVDVDG